MDGSRKFYYLIGRNTLNETGENIKKKFMPSQQVIHFTMQQPVMVIKKNVFGSQPEKENYYKL